MNINGESGKCRNQQVGDWRYDNDSIEVRSVPLQDWRYEFLIMLHEQIECAMCKLHGITDKQVSEFDEQFERERANGMHSQQDEDGDDPRAPYRTEHFFATSIERLVAAELRVNWKHYEQEILKAT